jgi:hypothetical protein
MSSYGYGQFCESVLLIADPRGLIIAYACQSMPQVLLAILPATTLRATLIQHVAEGEYHAKASYNGARIDLLDTHPHEIASSRDWAWPLWPAQRDVLFPLSLLRGLDESIREY